MLQTLNNNINNNNNNAMYINPKKKVLSKWCANHGVSPNTSSSMVVNTTTITSSVKTEDTTNNNPCTISNNYSLYSPTAPHLSFTPHSHIENCSSSWSVVQCDEDYFRRNNCRLSTSISLTYSRDDTSCLTPQNGQIVLYSSLRYLLKHTFNLTSTSNPNLPQILFMNVELVGGTIKEKIDGVISHSTEMSAATKKVFKADTRLQIEKVQSYKQAVHFKLSLFDLSDLSHAICVLESVSFNVFARKKQDGSLSPKTKKSNTRNIATKRSMSPTDDNEKLAKQPKVDSFSNSVSNTVSYAQSHTTAPINASDMQLTVGSLSLLANVLTNPSNFLDDEEESEHDLEIDDGEEPVNHDTQLLCTYEHQLKELISHISLLSSEERAFALQSAIVALR